LGTEAVESRSVGIEHPGPRHRVPVGYQSAPTICHHRTAHASLAALATSCCGRPRELKATRQSLGSYIHAKAGHKILEVGRGEAPLACFTPRSVQVAADLNLLRTSSSISGAKAKNLTSRHPMDNSHVADPTAKRVLYQRKLFRSTERPDRTKLNVRGDNAAD
jgi:hypothetical protein